MVCLPATEAKVAVLLGSNHLVVSARQYISDYNLVLRHYITHLMATRWRRLVLYGI
jgi:hypothetical protein